MKTTRTVVTHRSSSNSRRQNGADFQTPPARQPQSGSRETKRPPMKLDGKTYDEIKAQCLREHRLFEDPDFPAAPSSISPHTRSTRPFEWKRPPVSKFLAYIRYGPTCDNFSSFFTFGAVWETEITVVVKKCLSRKNANEI